jgi:hypothetical protein
MAKRLARLALSLLPVFPSLASFASFTSFTAGAHAEPQQSVAVERDKLLLLTNGKSRYVAVVPFESVEHNMFYGDGKRFVVVPMRGRSAQGDTTFSLTFNDPRFYINYTNQTSVDLRDGKYSLTCGSHVTPLTVVDDKTKKDVLAAASFEKNPRKWEAYALARDNTGVYYYVDHGRTPETAKSFRLFIGKKGDLKQQKMTNIVSDSEGDIFSTKTGSMRLILDKKESSWIKGNKPSKLLLLPVDDNIAMIYTDLGVYSGERFGTPCDDM